MIFFLNLFKVRARAAKVIFVCCFRDPRGLLSREPDMFRLLTAIIVISARSRYSSAAVVDIFFLFFIFFIFLSERSARI